METMETMAVNLDVSLEDRIAASKSSSGPARSSRRGQGAAVRRERSAPYSKDLAPYKRGDAEGAWKHDLFPAAEGIPGGTLGARLQSQRKGRVDVSTVRGFLNTEREKGGRGASGGATSGISLRGAGKERTVVKVDNLLEGTTAADVEAIFKRVGPIVSSSLSKPSRDTVAVTLTYKNAQDASQAVQDYNGQVADGRTLQVSLVGANGDLLADKGALLGRISGNGDLLGNADGGSKMRSDAYLDAPGAKVLTTATFEQNGNGGNGRNNRRQNGRR